MVNQPGRKSRFTLFLLFSLAALSALTPAPSFAKSRAAHKSARSLPSRLGRARATSRSLTPQRNVGRLGRVTRDKTSISAAPDSKPLYSIVPSDTYLVLAGQRGDHYAVLMVDGRYGWVRKANVELLNYDVVTGRTGNPGVDSGNQLVQDAFKYLGLPYVWGGYSTTGTDCSGFIKAVYAQNGVNLPRVAREQAKIGQDVPPNQLQPGDRVYFSFKGKYIDHTGMYIGNGYFIHNSISNGRVAVDQLTTTKYWRRLVCARR